MPCAAEFGIIDNLDKNKDYGVSYKPKEHNCIAINDDLLDDWWSELVLMKTYFHSYSRPGFGLARWGVTLIPPESLPALYNIIVKEELTKTLDELNSLLSLIQKAILMDKYVIHYGV